MFIYAKNAIIDILLNNKRAHMIKSVGFEILKFYFKHMENIVKKCYNYK